MATGTVRWFNRIKGYGFITPDEGGNDAYVHISSLGRAGISGLDEGQRVEYELQPGRDGKSAARVVTCNKRRICGMVHESQISTSLVERQNLTMRMSMRRLTRLTNAFSKKLDNLKAATALHFAHYNFCRIHKTLRITPAMAAGLVEHVWEVSDLLPT